MSNVYTDCDSRYIIGLLVYCGVYSQTQYMNIDKHMNLLKRY